MTMQGKLDGKQGDKLLLASRDGKRRLPGDPFPGLLGSRVPPTGSRHIWRLRCEQTPGYIFFANRHIPAREK